MRKKTYDLSIEKGIKLVVRGKILSVGTPEQLKTGLYRFARVISEEDTIHIDLLPTAVEFGLGPDEYINMVRLIGKHYAKVSLWTRIKNKIKRIFG